MKHLQPVIYPLIKWYYKKPRVINKRGISMTLLPSVFHPSLYHSTDVLLDFALEHNLEGKNILELGCGNAFISLFLAAHSKGNVFVSDINPQAISGVNLNTADLDLKIESYTSDLFEDIPKQQFDFILINPPYFKKAVSSTDEYAFYAGPNFEYFHNLFNNYAEYIKEESKVYMIFSDSTKIEEIKILAMRYNAELILRKESKVASETFMIYQILRHSN